MQKFNIQIRDIEKKWEETPSKTMAFESREDATVFCTQLSYMLEGKEIRLSQGKLIGSQGTYIRY